jgi:hypothetical protein
LLKVDYSALHDLVCSGKTVEYVAISLGLFKTCFFARAGKKGTQLMRNLTHNWSLFIALFVLAVIVFLWIYSTYVGPITFSLYL